MIRFAVVRFKFLRSFFLTFAVLNGLVLFFVSPLISFAFSILTLALVAMCIRCPECGKSPYIIRSGSLRIGTPIPEGICSKCGHTFSTRPDSGAV